MKKHFYIAVTILSLFGMALAACSGAAPTIAAGEPTATTGSNPTSKPSDPTATAAIQDSPTATMESAAPPEQGIPVPPLGGVEMHSISSEGGLPTVQSTGAHWIRRNALLWSRVEPEEGARNWEAIATLEQEMQNASEAGLELILIVRDAPTWAQQLPGVSCGPVAPEKMDAFANFMQDVVERYSAPPYNVKYWEMGNEPDVVSGMVDPTSIFGCWGDQNDPYYGGGAYGEMLKKVYPAIKAADPESQVMIGSLLLDCDPVNPPEKPAGSGQRADCSSGLFLEGILQAGGANYFDIVGYHAYEYYYGIYGAPSAFGNINWHTEWNKTGPALVAKVRYIRDVLAQYNASDKAIMNTEVALICTGSQAECAQEDFEMTKAAYAAQAFPAAASEGLLANVWYSIYGWRYSELIKHDQTRLPVADAITVSLTFLDGAAFVREINDFPGFLGYEFMKEGSRYWVIWALGSEADTLQLPQTPAEVLDLFGNPLTPSSELSVSLAPVYIFWEE